MLAFITSRTPPDLLASDLILDAADANFAATGLRVTSTLRLHRLMTATDALIRRELGELPPSLHAAVDDKLRQLFNLPT
ncbi:MAG: hypothetical protein ABR577_12370 [Pyrinomonadaceae bacterium]